MLTFHCEIFLDYHLNYKDYEDAGLNKQEETFKLAFSTELCQVMFMYEAGIDSVCLIIIIRFKIQDNFINPLKGNSFDSSHHNLLVHINKIKHRKKKRRVGSCVQKYKISVQSQQALVVHYKGIIKYIYLFIFLLPTTLILTKSLQKSCF